MLRNSDDYVDIDDEIELDKKSKVINLKNIITFVLSFLMGQVSFAFGIAPFGMSFFAANMKNKTPLVISFVGIMLGTLVKFGIQSTIIFMCSALLFIFLTVFIKNKDKDGLSKLKLFCSVLIVNLVPILFTQFLIYDIVLAVTLAISTTVFYIVFAYGENVVLNYREKIMFSVEEIIGASILCCIAISALGNLEIYQFNIRNILCIFIVLVLGWKNGATIGTTSGVTIGSILALLGAGDVSLIASYAISGLLAGVFCKFGKLGVVAGFVLGNALLAIFANGSVEVIILLKEIVVSSVMLLLLPKKIEYKMDDIFEKTLLLKDATDAEYEVNEKVVYRLNNVSEAFENMAETLGESAATLVNNKEEVLQFFEDVTAKVCTDCGEDENCWTKDLYVKYTMIFKIIDILLEKNEITVEEFDNIVECKCKKSSEFVKSINGTYDLYKLNEQWKKRLHENREIISKQLKGFSEVISSIVEDINEKKESKKEKAKFKVTIGVSKTAKENNAVNGDNNLILKLENGKYVIGLSDGMGSGEEADKSSKIVMEMLEKFLKSGFDKTSAVQLINSLMLLKSEKDNFATMDISVVDTKTGSVEFVKVGACPTFIKKKDRVEFVNSISLPVGIVDHIDVDLYDKKLEDGDYIIMVTDGIIESNKELNNMWIKELLEKTNIDNPQRLADVIMQESVDNSFGVAKDDMTVVVSKIKTNL